MKKYVFPFNYDQSNRIMGILEYKLILPLSLYGGILLILLSLFSLSIFTKIGIFTILFFPLALLLNTSIYGEPFYIFAFFVMKHLLSAHKYLLTLPTNHPKKP